MKPWLSGKNNGHYSHGLKHHPLYNTWATMMSRCYNSNRTSYQYYGARGISVDQRWHDISMFIEDMSPRPEGLTLDRVDNNGPYSMDNCRWASRKEQLRNRRDNRLITFRGETRCMAEWGEIHGKSIDTLYYRLKVGMSIEDVFLKPVVQRSPRSVRKP